MDKAEMAAQADAILRAEGLIAGGDAPVSSSSEEPAVPEVTPPVEGGQPAVEAGSDDAKATPEEIKFPAWVPEGSKEAREAAFGAMEDRRVSIERDATEKWMAAKELERDAKRWQALTKDKDKAPKVLAILEEPSAPPVDPRLALLAETMGEDAAKAVLGLIDDRAEQRVSKVITERFDAPSQHRAQVDEAGLAFRQELGNRVSDAEFNLAVKSVALELGGSPDNLEAAYAQLTPANVKTYLSLALKAVKAATPTAPAASPPKAPVSRPASVQSNGMAHDSKADPAWKLENRVPRPGEQAAETMRRAGVTEADVQRLMQSM